MSAPTAASAARAFEQHGPAVRRYFRRLTGDATQADDLTQEVFLRVVRSAERYEPQERERVWILRIARNVLVDDQHPHNRSLERHIAVDAGTPAGQAAATDLHHAPERLPPDERETFLFGEVGGLTYAEIAATTESTVPAVRSRIYRARLSLRATLTPSAPLGPGAFPLRDDDE